MFNSKSFHLMNEGEARKRERLYQPKRYRWLKYIIIPALIGFALLLILSNVDFSGTAYDEEAAITTEITTDLTTAEDGFDESTTLGLSARMIDLETSARASNCYDKDCSYICSSGTIGTIKSDLQRLQSYCTDDLVLILEYCSFPNGRMKADFLSGTYRLKNLTINDCGLESIDDGAFDQDSVKNLKTLLLVKSLFISLSEETFRGLSAIEQFSMQNVQRLTALTAKDFLVPIAATIQEVVLQHETSNSIYDPTDWLAGGGSNFTELRTLNMSGNNFGATLNQLTFSWLVRVEELRLANCNLSYINNGTFDGIMQTLTYLDLSDNQLVTISWEFLSLQQQQFALIIHRNTWECTCDNIDMIMWVQANEEYQVDDPTCTTPAELYNIPVNSVSLSCDDTITTTTTIATTTAVITTTIKPKTTMDFASTTSESSEESSVSDTSEWTSETDETQEMESTTMSTTTEVPSTTDNSTTSQESSVDVPTTTTTISSEVVTPTDMTTADTTTSATTAPVTVTTTDATTTTSNTASVTTSNAITATTAIISPDTSTRTPTTTETSTASNTASVTTSNAITATTAIISPDTSTRTPTTTETSTTSVPAENLYISIECQYEPQIRVLTISKYDAQFTISTESTRSVRLIVQSDMSQLRLMYFYQNSTFDTVDSGYSDVSDTSRMHCQHVANTSIRSLKSTTTASVLHIDGLLKNNTYIFCLVPRSQYRTSPFNCRSHFLAASLGNTLEWLDSDDIAWFVSIIIFSAVVCLLIGLILTYWMLRLRPAWLRGSNGLQQISPHSKEVLLFRKSAQFSLEEQYAFCEIILKNGSISESYQSEQSYDYMQFYRNLKQNKLMATTRSSTSRPPEERAPVVPRLSHPSRPTSTQSTLRIDDIISEQDEEQHEYESLEYYQELF